MRDPERVRSTLEAWIAEQRGVHSPVVAFRRFSTGHSRAMWYLELADGERLVVRIEQGGVFGTSGADEYRFMQAAGRLGCPVATVRWIEPTGDLIGQPFFVMDFLPGAAMEREERTLPEPVSADFVRRLHELHEVRWEDELTADFGDGSEDGDGGSQAIHAQIDRWTAVYRAASALPIPLLDEAEVWLHRHAPRLERPVIVHGDPGPGNFVHDGARVVALTDWEFAHLGDPMEDWVYVLSMRGTRTMGRAAWCALFGDIAGVEPSDADIRYWSAFNHFKGACANLTCLVAFGGANPAPNMAIIGTALQQTFLRKLADLVAHD